MRLTNISGNIAYIGGYQTELEPKQAHEVVRLAPGEWVEVPDMAMYTSEIIRDLIDQGILEASMFGSSDISAVLQQELTAAIASLSGAYLDGGNAFGETAELGTNDNFDLLIRRNSAEYLGLLEDGSGVKSVRVDNTVDHFCLGHQLDEIADATFKLIIGLVHQGQLLDITEGSKSEWKNIVVSDTAGDSGAIHFYRMRGSLASFSDVQAGDTIFNMNSHAWWTGFSRTTFVFSNTIDSTTNWPSSSLILGLFEDQPANQRTNVWKASPDEFVVNPGDFAANRDVNFRVLDTSAADLFKVDVTAGEVTVTGKLTVTGLIDPTGLVFDEQSSVPDTPAAGKGILWVKDDAPNTLWFTDDAGTDFQIGTVSGSGSWDIGGNALGAAGILGSTTGADVIFQRGGIDKARLSDDADFIVSPIDHNTWNSALVDTGLDRLVVGDQGTSSVLTKMVHSGSSGHPILRGITTGGVLATPTDVVVSRALFEINARGWVTSLRDGGGWKVVTDSVAGGDLTTRQEFTVADSGGTIVEPLRVKWNQVLVNNANADIDLVVNDVTAELVRFNAANRQVELFAGSAAAPSLTFAGDLDTGLYRVGADDFGIAINGGQALRLETISALVTCSVNRFGSNAGFGDTPVFGNLNDADTGLAFPAADQMSLRAGGVEFMKLIEDATDYMESFVQHRFPDGSAGAPGVGFATGVNVGFYKTGSSLAATNAGLVQLWDPTKIQSRVTHEFEDGSAAIPSISFRNHTNDGFYISGGDLAMARGGANYATFAGNADWTTAVRVPAGSAAAPSLRSTVGGSNVGLYFTSNTMKVGGGSLELMNVEYTDGTFKGLVDILRRFNVSAVALTSLTASTEMTGVDVDLSATQTFAAGALATQRAMRIQAPTYAFDGASLISKAVTVSIEGAPSAGTNATITEALALEVSGGAKISGNSAVVLEVNAAIDGLGFFTASAVTQQSGTGETTGFTAGAGTGVNDDSTFTGNVGATAYRISDVVKALKNYGLLAS